MRETGCCLAPSGVIGHAEGGYKLGSANEMATRLVVYQTQGSHALWACGPALSREHVSIL